MDHLTFYGFTYNLNYLALCGYEAICSASASPPSTLDHGQENRQGSSQ